MTSPSAEHRMMRAAACWVDAVATLGGDATLAVDSGAELERRYAEPHRRYHRTSHVEAVLADAAALAAQLGLGTRDRAILTLAVCAHDVVYDARPGDDERASAAWARAHLERSRVAEEVIERVEALVLTTLTHDVPAGDDVAAVLSDADLSILGAAADAYDGYSTAVRLEFASVPDDMWRAGRRYVLQQLLDRERLYLTEAGAQRWEARARANITRELMGIQG